MPALVRWGRAAGGVAMAALLLAACSVGSAAPKATTPGRGAAAPGAKPPRTTTTTAVPGAAEATAEEAADTLVADWAEGNRSGALSVATSSAVGTLFAVPYPEGLAIDRGCTDAFTPIICTFGPPGGADPNDPLYSLNVVQAPGGGWYVSSAQIEQ